MFKHVRDFNVPFKEGRYVYVVTDNNYNTIKQILDLHQIKIINDNVSITLEKYNGKYYDVDTRDQIQLQKYLQKILPDNFNTIILTSQPDTLITDLISKKKVFIAFNDFDNELIKVDYHTILNILLKHNLIGGRVGSFMGQYDNKMLYYVEGYDLKEHNCYGAKLDDVFIKEKYADLCDHIINLYINYKDKPIQPTLEKIFSEQQHNINYGHIMNYFGDISKFINK